MIHGMIYMNIHFIWYEIWVIWYEIWVIWYEGLLIWDEGHLILLGFLIENWMRGCSYDMRGCSYDMKGCSYDMRFGSYDMMVGMVWYEIWYCLHPTSYIFPCFKVILIRPTLDWTCSICSTSWLEFDMPWYRKHDVA